MPQSTNESGLQPRDPYGPDHTQEPHTPIYTHPFNGPLSRTTRVSRYQKGKTNLDFTDARDSEWQRHQLGHMQVCTSLQTDNHASTPPLSFFTRTNSFKIKRSVWNSLKRTLLRWWASIRMNIHSFTSYLNRYYTIALINILDLIWAVASSLFSYQVWVFFSAASLQVFVWSTSKSSTLQFGIHAFSPKLVSYFLKTCPLN